MSGKWIIFGASGFIGRTLLPLLDKKHIRYFAPSSRDINLCLESAPDLIQQRMQDGDNILMLSALTPEKGNARSLTMQNVAMVNHVLQGIATKNPGHFIYVSSDAVYPLTAEMVDESTPTIAGSLYGQMHVLREQYVKEAIAPSQLTIFRPCAVYGHGDTHNAYGVSRFIRSARQAGEITLFGAGEEYRDHIHVEDVAAILGAAMLKPVHGVFNMASGQSWRFSAIAHHIKEHMQAPVHIIQKPRAMPIFHRHMDILALRRNFPLHPPRRIDKGIAGELKGAHER